MENLYVDLKNCWGIQELTYKFDFSGNKNKAYSIYAPNGVMKTSFAKTFDALSKGEAPKEERYRRKTTYKIESDGKPINKEEIYVLKSEMDTPKAEEALSNILVNPHYRDRFVELNKDIDKKKKELIRSLQAISKLPAKEVEPMIMQDLNMNSFSDCIELLLEEEIFDLGKFPYGTLFDHRVITILNNADFRANAIEFINRYHDLFEQADDIYLKNVFNPMQADSVFSEMKKQQFFEAGHKVHLRGGKYSIDGTQLEERLKEANELINSDKQLKKIKDSLAKNVQTKALVNLLEALSATEVNFLLENMKPENQNEFRKKLWTFYVNVKLESKSYMRTYNENKEELKKIEDDAKEIARAWSNIVELFNDRFVDMPFVPEIANQEKAVTGQEAAEVVFKFKDDEEDISYTADDDKMKTLSTGEERALNLLYFIFEVENRRLSNIKTLFVIDDIADSFDYKNKHAIILYLQDLCKVDHFRLILLTHNFDFFRAISRGFIHRTRCLLTNWNNENISLYEAQGIENVFIKMWKSKVQNNDTILCATVPFTRNLIEYTKESNSSDFKKLTSLLHWKEDTCKITVNDYIAIYNSFFGTKHPCNRSVLMIDLLYQQADLICKETTRSGFNLEEKVLLSIAVRIYAEQFIINTIRTISNDPAYWFEGNNQFGKMYEELKTIDPNLKEKTILDKVSVTVSSNIHLNSFMYEPILDLSIDDLIHLYKDVKEIALSYS